MNKEEARHKLLSQLRNKQISVNYPHETCDICGHEIEEPPMMNCGTTVCQACFWNWIKQSAVRKKT